MLTPDFGMPSTSVQAFLTELAMSSFGKRGSIRIGELPTNCRTQGGN